MQRKVRSQKNTHARSCQQLECIVALSAPEQELNTIRQAAVGVLPLRRALKLGKSACVLPLDLLFVRPPPPAEPKGARSAGPIGVRGSVSPTKFYNEKFPLVYESDNSRDSLYEEHGATMKHKCGKRIVALPLLSFSLIFLFGPFLFFMASFFGLLWPLFFRPESHPDLWGNHSLHHPFLTRTML